MRTSTRTLAAAGAAAAVTLLAASPAGAHTGQSLGGAVDGATHPMLGVDHLLAILAVGAIAALARDRRIAWLTPTGFVVGMVAGGALGMAGIALPFVEAAIAASVVGAGVLVLRPVTGGAAWALPFLAAAAGIAHGHAHGAEAPSAASPVAYVAGFVVATAALHALGAAAGLGLRRATAARVAAGAALSVTGAALLLGA